MQRDVQVVRPSFLLPFPVDGFTFLLALFLVSLVLAPQEQALASQPDLSERQLQGQLAERFNYSTSSGSCSSLFIDGEGGAENAPVTGTDSVTVPEGTQSITVRVVLFSREWPEWTGSQSQFDDIVAWETSLDGSTLSSGQLTVNGLHSSFVPGPLPGGNFQIYSENIDTSEMTAENEVTLSRFGSATNIADSLLGSGVLIESCLGDIEDGEAEISGRITAIDTGDPLVGASVTLDTGESTLTNTQGRFLFEEVAPGTRVVTADKDDYFEASQSIVLSDGDVREVDLALSPVGDIIVKIEGDHFSPQNRAFFLAGIDHEETVNVFVEWGDLPPGTVEIQTASGTFATSSTDQAIYSATINVGNLSAGESLEAVATLEDGSTDAMTANLEAIPPLISEHFPDLAGVLSWHSESSGGKVKYSTNVPQRAILSGLVPESVISDNALLIKTPWSVEFLLPGPLTIESDGTASMRIVEAATASESFGAFKIGEFFSAKPKGSFNLNWGWDGTSWLTGGSLNASFGVKWEPHRNSVFVIPPPSPPIPVPYFFGAEFTGSVAAAFDVKPTPAAPIDWQVGGGGSGKAGGALFGGLGNTNIAGIKLSGGVDFDVDLLYVSSNVDIFDDLGFLGFGALEIFVEGFFGFGFEFELLRFEGCIWRLKGCPSSGLSVLANEPLMRVSPETNSYLANLSMDMGQLPSYQQGLIVDADAMLVANPVIVETESGTRVLVRLTEGAERDFFDRGELVFSTFENDQWSTPQAIRVNNTADREPVALALEDDRILIAFRNATTNLPGEPDGDVELALEALNELWTENEVSVIEFDVSNGAVIEEWSLGQAGQFDGDIRLASGYEDNAPLIAWMQSSESSPVAYEDQPANILVSRLEPGGPTTPVAAASALESLAGFDIADSANGPIVVFSSSTTDSNSTTAFELFLVEDVLDSQGPAISQLSSDGERANLQPSLARSGADLVLAWSSDSAAYWSWLNGPTLQPSALDSELAAPGSRIELTNSVDDRVLATWTVGDIEAMNLAFSILEPGEEAFSPRRMLTDDPGSPSRQFSILGANGDIVSTFNFQPRSKLDEPVENNVATVWRTGGSFDLAADPNSLELLPPNPMAGTQATVSMDVVNLGDLPSDVVEVWFYTNEVSNNNILRINVVDEPIAPGQSRTVTATWNVPAVDAEETIIVSVDQPQLTNDVDRTNNQISIDELLQPDLEAAELRVSRVGSETLKVRGTIKNVSARHVGSFDVELRLDSPEGPLLLGQSLDNLSAGTSRDISFIWESPTLLGSGSRRVFLVVDPDAQVEQYSRTNLVTHATASLSIEEGLVLDEADFETEQGTSLPSTLVLSNRFPFAINELSCFIIDDGEGAFGLAVEPVGLQVMEPGEDLQLQLQFTPPTAGTFEGALGCMSEGLSQPIVISLRGTGSGTASEPIAVPVGTRGILIFLLFLGFLIVAARALARI